MHMDEHSCVFISVCVCVSSNYKVAGKSPDIKVESILTRDFMHSKQTWVAGVDIFTVDTHSSLFQFRTIFWFDLYQ